MLLLHFLCVAVGDSHGVVPEQMKAKGELEISCGRAELLYMQGAWMLMRGRGCLVLCGMSGRGR